MMSYTMFRQQHMNHEDVLCESVKQNKENGGIIQTTRSSCSLFDSPHTGLDTLRAGTYQQIIQYYFYKNNSLNEKRQMLQ